jgi:hypothetical protein
MGGRCRADRRGGARPLPRPCRRHRTDRLGVRLGRRSTALHRVVRDLPRGNGMADAVLDRHPSGGPGVLDPPLRDRARHPSRQAGAGGPGAHGLDAEAGLSGDHAESGADGDRRAGRQLRAVGVAADLPQDGAAPDIGRHRQLSAGAYPWCVLRLRLGRLSRRCARTQNDVHDLRDRFDDPRAGLHPRTHQRRNDSVRRLSVGLHHLHDVLADGVLHDRAVPHAGARHRAGLLLQRRPRTRRAVPGVGRLPGRADDAGAGHRRVRRDRLRADDPGAADAAGDPRPIVAGA